MPARLTDHLTLEPATLPDLRKPVAILWAGKWIIAACMAAFVFAGTYYAFHVATPQFAATSVLRIDPQPPDLRDVSDHWPAPQADAASIQTELAVLTSDRILGEVVRQQSLLTDAEFNRYLTPASPYSVTGLRNWLRYALGGAKNNQPDADGIRAKAVANLRAATEARNPTGTHLIEIRVRSRDAGKAALLANAIAQVYLETQIAVRNAAVDADIAWLTERVAALQAQLQQRHLDTGQTAHANSGELIDKGIGQDEAETIRQLHTAFLTRLQEAEIQRGLDIAEASMLSLATPGRFVGPRKIVTMQFSALLGLFVGAAVAALRHLARRTVLHPDMIENLTGMPPVVILSETEMAAQDALGKQKLAMGLTVANQRQKPQVILVTGIVGDTPPVSLIETIASAFSSDQASTICVALDQSGLRLADNDGLEQRVLSSADLIDNANLTRFFDDLRKTYQTIVVYAGPLAAASPAQLLAAHADLSLLAIEFAKTPKNKIEVAHIRLSAAAPTPVAVVLTHVQPRKLRQFAWSYGFTAAPT